MGSNGDSKTEFRLKDITTWVELYTKDLLSWAAYKTSDKELAQDLVQDVFLVASAKYDTFKGDSQPKTWLIAILNNKIAEHYRKASSRPKVDSMNDPFFNEKGNWKDETAPNNWMENNELQLLDNKKFLNVWHHCIDNLPTNQSLCIRRKFINDEESDQICQDLNISASNYWQLLHRAKLKLRSCLEKSWFTK